MNGDPVGGEGAAASAPSEDPMIGPPIGRPTAADIPARVADEPRASTKAAGQPGAMDADTRSRASLLPRDGIGASSVPGLAMRTAAPVHVAGDLTLPAIATSGLLSRIVGAETDSVGRLVGKEITGLFGGALSTKLVEQWRDTLLIGRGAARTQVASAMSTAIADANLRPLALAGIAPTWTGATLGSRVAEAVSGYVTGIGAELRIAIIESLRPAALAATGAMIERIKASSEAERRYEAALWRMGWWVPPSATMQFFWEAGGLADQGQRHELRRVMTEAARSREFGRIVESWMELEPFRRRRRFIRDGLLDHRRGRYRVSIPVLLPLIEGIAIEAFAPGSTDTHPRRAVGAAAEIDTVMGPAMVEAVTVLWARHDFSTTAASSRTLNRQLILHGRSTGYATEANSAKVLFALDLLASLVHEAARRS